jgi:hypothetical protein
MDNKMDNKMDSNEIVKDHEDLDKIIKEMSAEEILASLKYARSQTPNLRIAESITIDLTKESQEAFKNIPKSHSSSLFSNRSVDSQYGSQYKPHILDAPKKKVRNGSSIKRKNLLSHGLEANCVLRLKTDLRLTYRSISRLREYMEDTMKTIYNVREQLDSLSIKEVYDEPDYDSDSFI